LPRLKFRREPALRRWLTFRERTAEGLLLAGPSSSARYAKGSIFSEPPIPLYTKLDPVVAAKPVLLELPSSRRGFLKIEYCGDINY